MRKESSIPAFEMLKEYMIQNHNVKVTSNGKEIIKRCHICGDSRDQSKAHMYIGLRNDGKICYNCFKCNSGGYVDGKFLRDIGCYDTDIINACTTQNNVKFDYNSPNKSIVNNIYYRNLYIPNIDMRNEFSVKKLQYLEKRTGVAFGPYDPQKFKIVLNIKEFLLYNNIDRFTRNEDLVDLLDKFFIGFLSTDNKYVILRRLIPSGKLPEYIDYRYLNYNIYGRDDGVKFYTVPGMIDTTKTIEIHVAEGVFDILSVYLNLLPYNSNAICGAICGKSYKSILQYFISTYGLCNFTLHLYMDADVGDNNLKSIVNQLRIYGCNIYIHRNRFNGEKDYGVPLNRIYDKVYQLK